MRPLAARILEVREQTAEVKTLRFDLNLDPAPGQYAMVWIRGIDEIPMSFSGPAGSRKRELAGWPRISLAFLRKLMPPPFQGCGP
jgi:NAD(P)H-flavin reductase